MKKLTLEEEYELIQQAKEGDVEPLYEQFKYLMQLWSRKLYPKATFEEQLGRMFIKFLACVDKFDMTKGYRFSTYLTRSLYFDSRGTDRKFIKTTKEYNLRDIRKEDLAYLVDMDLSDEIENLFKKMGNLTDREVDILIRRFGHEETYDQIAERYGVSKERIRQIKNRLLEELRRLYGII